MLTALEGVCCRGQQTLPEVTAAKHLALAEVHVSEVSAGRTASVPPEGIKLPVIQETPLLHQPPVLAQGKGNPLESDLKNQAW